jgi:hypothetical protein
MRCLLASADGHEMATSRGGKRTSIYTPVALTAYAPPLVVRSVGSNVIVNAGNRGNGNRLHVDAGRVDGRYGHCRASQDRSGRAECYDSGNDENSPDSHDSSMAIPEASGLLHGPVGLHGASTFLRSFFP